MAVGKQAGEEVAWVNGGKKRSIFKSVHRVMKLLKATPPPDEF